MKGYRLEILSTAELLDLRDYADRLIRQRIKKERRVLENTLARISKATGEQPPARTRPSSLKGIKVPPKYENPQTGQVWSGRGVVPRWLKPLLEQGRKLEAFAIGAQAKRRGSIGRRKAARGRPKTRQPKKRVGAKRLTKTTRKAGRPPKRKAS